MTTPVTTGVCVIWTNSAAVSATFSDVASALTDNSLTIAQLDLACAQASDILYMLSGRQYGGLCERTFRPMARPISWTVAEWSQYFESLSGSNYSASWGTCFGGYHDACRNPPQIDLGAFPLRQIIQVKIDGTVIPANEYRIDNSRLLVRVMPTANSTPTVRWGWPTCQNLELPDTEVNTFSVDAKYGMEPPSSGVAAAVALAGELALAHASQPNRLPARLISITRQGVSMAVMDPMQFLDHGLTGVYEADIFIRAANPQRQRRRPRVYSRDVGYSR